MQKVFSTTEKLFVFLSLLGLAFKFMLWKGGDFMLIVSLSLLSILYFAGSYFQPEAHTKQNNQPLQASVGTVLLKIFSGVAFSTVVVALLFKLLFWKGSFFMLLAGVAATVFILVLALASSNGLTKPSETAIFRRGAIIICLGIAAFLVSSSTLYRVFHRNDPQLVEKWIRMSDHPNNPAYRADFDAYRRHQYPASR